MLILILILIMILMTILLKHLRTYKITKDLHVEVNLTAIIAAIMMMKEKIDVLEKRH